MGGEERHWALAAVGVIVVLVAADLVLGAEVQFTGSLVIAPFIASARLSPQRTLAVGVLALAAVTFLGSFNDAGSVEAALRLLVVVAGSGLAVWIAALRQRREQELRQVTRVAEVAQRAVLTSVPRRVGPLAFASRYQSASPEALIGGDFYEVVESEGGRVRAVVGDVRGKGLEAVRLAAVVLGSFREAAQSLDTLEDVASMMDRRLRRHLDTEDFVTAVLAEFQEDGTLTIVNCGHHAPLLIQDGALRLLPPAATTTPLGLDPVPVPERAVMGRGDRLLLYTDGLVEARSRSGRMIALDRLAVTLTTPDLDGALESLVETLESLVIGPIEDDMALVLAEYRGFGPAQDPDERRIVSMTTE
ncbi:MAG: PP2C family protein-serine/threonine phosphatase [Acidimicrobiales bacterium]